MSDKQHWPEDVDDPKHPVENPDRPDDAPPGVTPSSPTTIPPNPTHPVPEQSAAFLDFLIDDFVQAQDTLREWEEEQATQPGGIILPDWMMKKSRGKKFVLKAKPAPPPERVRSRRTPWEQTRDDYAPAIKRLLEAWGLSCAIRLGGRYPSHEYFSSAGFKRHRRAWTGVFLTLLQNGKPERLILDTLTQGLDNLRYPIESPWPWLKAFDAITENRAQTYGMRDLRDRLAVEALNRGEDLNRQEGDPWLKGPLLGEQEPATFLPVKVYSREERVALYGEEHVRWRDAIYGY